MAAQHPSTDPKGRRVEEYVAVAALVASALCALALSWRKWPDPIADVGHQLYTAWRLAQGAVLYRDVGCLYGPFSSYLNALLFRVFGPGMMVLVAANLTVYFAIAGLAYRLFRAAYGTGVAVAVLAVFVWVFSFNQLMGLPNYTYALPYAHESTHGLLVSLALILAASRWIAGPRIVHALVLGLLCGLAFVIKPEFMLVSALVVGSAVFVRIRMGRPPRAIEIACAGVAWMTPTALFTIYFWQRLPLAAAFRAANQAWWPVVVNHVSAHIWASFSGTDAVLHNLTKLASATAVLALALGVMWVGARFALRGVRLAVVLIAVPSAIALAYADWMLAAWCVPLTLLAVLGSHIVKTVRDPAAQSPLGLLLASAAFALLVRMFLHPRFFHFGFYQAALATMVVLAEILSLLRQFAGQHKLARLVLHVSAGFMVVAACLAIFLPSARSYSRRTFPVGSGRDRFFALAPARDPSGSLDRQVVDELRRLPPDDTVLVVPEGLMINYLARRKSPLPEWVFIDLTLAGPAEAALVQRLAASPPAVVVYLHRELGEHGISQWGDPGQPGYLMLKFFQQNYRPRLSLAGNPADPNRPGALILARAP